MGAIMAIETSSVWGGRLLQNAGLQQVSKSVAAARNTGILVIRTVNQIAVTTPAPNTLGKGDINVRGGNSYCSTFSSK